MSRSIYKYDDYSFKFLLTFHISSFAININVYIYAHFFSAFSHHLKKQRNDELKNFPELCGVCMGEE